MSLESAVRELVERETAPMLERLDLLERKLAVKETPEALLTVRQLVERHPALTEGGVRWMLRTRRANGLDSAVLRHGTRLMISERRFLEWMMKERGEASRTGNGRPFGRRRRRGGRS